MRGATPPLTARLHCSFKCDQDGSTEKVGVVVEELTGPVPVTARAVYGVALLPLAGSNPASDTNACLLSILCVWPIPRPEECDQSQQ
jgi:hypothetical protein